MRALRGIACLLLLAALLLAASCGGGELYAMPTDGEVSITFLDVLQADCAIVRTSDAVIVVDTGATREDGEALISYLRRAGIQRIDLLILSHPHEDHIGGVAALLREYDVAECLMTDIVEDSAAFHAALSALTDEGCEATRAVAGVIKECGALSVEVLSPTKEFYSTINDACAVVRVRYGDFSVLFTGDISDNVEEELVSLYGEALDSDILKVAHHGSSTSTCESFLAAVTPQFAVVSCAAGNEYGFPHTEVLERLSDAETSLYRTDVDGTIVFSVKDGLVTINNKK